jgi:hypothetical protein
MPFYELGIGTPDSVATDLARLWMQLGKRAEARDLLSSVYGPFSEGFDTRDLKEADALLVQLQ